MVQPQASLMHTEYIHSKMIILVQRVNYRMVKEQASMTANVCHLEFISVSSFFICNFILKSYIR